MELLRSERTFGGWMTTIQLDDGRELRYGRSKSPLRRGFSGYFVSIEGERERQWSIRAEGGGADRKMATFLRHRLGLEVVIPTP